MDSPVQLPFSEAIDFFRKKIQLPSASWTDIWQEQHSLAFVVAGAKNDALVSDFYNVLRKAKESGTGYSEFRADFDNIVKRHGWTHNGSAGWRSKVIYDTNMTQAYNAGRYQQMWALRDIRPYWRYRHTSIEHPRLEHKAWDGKVLPADDAWWNTHYPANGWGCKCRVDSLTQSEAKADWSARGRTGPDDAPPIEWETKTVGKLGANPREVRVPKGIDAGFGYNPGRAYLEPHTVPPLTGYDAVLKTRDQAWPSSLPKPALPVPTSVASIFAKSPVTNPEQSVTDFLAYFGASLAQGASFIDAAGSALAVSKSLFTDGQGQFKWVKSAEKEGRLENINLLAMTLADPDEIWWDWVKDDKEAGRWRLKRRYLKAFEVDQTREWGISVFEWSSAGWTGATVFSPDKPTPSRNAQYFERQRAGRLIYKKQGDPARSP